MGKTWLFAALTATVLLVTAARTEVQAQSASTSSAPAVAAPTGTGVPAAPEPITGTPATSAPGWETPPKDPFAPFDLRRATKDTSPKPFWAYADLTAAEQAVADKGRDTSTWPAVHSAYATAAAELAHRAATSAAASQLGITDPLGGIGVVP